MILLIDNYVKPLFKLSDSSQYEEEMMNLKGVTITKQED